MSKEFSSNPAYIEWFPNAKYDQLTQLKTIFMAISDTGKRYITDVDYIDYLTQYGNGLFDDEAMATIITMCQNEREQVEGKFEYLRNS